MADSSVPIFAERSFPYLTTKVLMFSFLSASKSPIAWKMWLDAWKRNSGIMHNRAFSYCFSMNGREKSIESWFAACIPIRNGSTPAPMPTVIRSIIARFFRWMGGTE